METNISASVEETRVTIYGFTCPNCKVEINNPYIYAVTQSTVSNIFIVQRISNIILKQTSY
jgi:hypothetical protein